MIQVGIRDLRQNASEIVRRVASGEPVEVTVRGRAMVRMVPLRPVGGAQQLIAEGRMTLPARRGANLSAHRPLPAPPGAPTGSQALAELRADER